MEKTRTIHIDQTYVSPPRDDKGGRRRPFLLVLSGPQFGELFDLEPGRAHVVGRLEGCDILIRDDAVSRRHANITPVEHGAQLEDLGSANGTFVNGQRVTDCRLFDGDRLQLGSHTTLKFVWSDDVEAEYQRRLAQGALYEPLTGLYNRRHFMARLSAELASIQRHGRPICVLMLDVDHFKRVNDTHGHLAGDEALRMVAKALAGVARTEDVVARFGGEEFVILARDTDLAGARALAERVRRSVESARCYFQGVEIAVTASVGVTVSAGAFEPSRTEQQLLEAADVALRRAKGSGRNTVVVVPPLGA
jgi:diguanylate cyclase (GGDEF)-like protein